MKTLHGMWIIAGLWSLSLFVSATQYAGYMQKPSGDFTKFSIAGWVCEVGNPQAMTVNVFAGETRQQASLIMQVEANKDAEQAVKNRCATDAQHRFKIELPQSLLFKHSEQFLFVEISNQSTPYIIPSAAQYRLPEFPDTKLRGFIDGIGQANNAYFVMGWACQTQVNESVSLQLSTRDAQGNKIVLLNNKHTGVVAENPIQRACNTSNGRHRFRIRLPEEVIQEYAGQAVYIEAKAAHGSANANLVFSGRHTIPNQLPILSSRKPNVVVFFTDDQGYADLGVQASRDDVLTPNIDALANQGARFTAGYITAPQCTPSRAAMITGQYQTKFALDENKHLPMSLEVETLASKFQQHGYRTGMIGKWHLEITSTSSEWAAINDPSNVPYNVNQVPRDLYYQYFPHQRGFDDMLAGYSGSYVRNVDRNGKSIALETFRSNEFRVDLVSDQSLSFIDQHWRKPFYLYAAHYAPHVPLEAVQKYLDAFPGEMPQRRRYALAMLKAIDDGVGRVVDKLEEYNLLDNTLILFISDNGAPLASYMEDKKPINKGGPIWNGSRNDPFTGEKGMLTEGGIRVPFIAHWPARIPAGQVIDTPVSALDAAYTSAKIAGITDLDDLDGMDLLPLIDGDESAFQERPLFWRFYFQRAVRQGDWKYMQAGIKREYLFDMTQDQPEAINLIEQYPEKAQTLKQLYWQWADQMPRPEPLVEIPKPYAVRVDHFLPTQ